MLDMLSIALFIACFIYSFIWLKLYMSFWLETFKDSFSTYVYCIISIFIIAVCYSYIIENIQDVVYAIENFLSSTEISTEIIKEASCEH